MTLAAVRQKKTSVGPLLRQWRQARKLTQLQLATEAEVSTRHLSFVETGRSKPSAEMLLILSSVLEVPLRERNALLAAAGFAPAYRETDLSAPEMAPVRTVLEFMLKQAEPYGAVVVDGCWNLLQANAAAQRFTANFVVDPAAVLKDGPPNMLRLLMHPQGIRERCVDWESLAAGMVARIHREISVTQNADLGALLEQVLSYEGVPPDWRRLDVCQSAPLMLPMHIRHGEHDLRFFTAITSLGTAQDVTLQELRVETFFPADADTDRQLRAMA